VTKVKKKAKENVGQSPFLGGGDGGRGIFKIIIHKVGQISTEGASTTYIVHCSTVV